MYDTGLANRIRAKAVRVKEVAGWQTRGSSAFRPRGSGNHHTAGSSRGATPSLSTVIYGRPDVIGPLANVLQSRESNPWDDIAYVIAAGKANHGGVGTWTGQSGTVNENVESHGLEIEHVGTTRVHGARLEIAARIQAAFLEAPGSSRDASMCWQHFEYARPLGRKIDFFDLAPTFTAATFRSRVAFWIGRTTTIPVDHRGVNTPVTPTTPKEWDEMATKEEIAAVIDARLDEFYKTRIDGLVAPSAIRIVRSGWEKGDPIFYTDLQSYIWATTENSEYDRMYKFFRTLAGRSTRAARFDQTFIDQLIADLPLVKI